MNFIVVGTGVIGTTYGWQLAKAGHHVTHWVRSQNKRDAISLDGISIRCLDLRTPKPRKIETIYQPPVITDLSEREADVVIVSVNSHQLETILPRLEQLPHDTTILFLQNLRIGDDELIAQRLSSDRYILGYPFKAGGCSHGTTIDTVIFGNLLAQTMLGHQDGSPSPLLSAVKAALKDANMFPQVSKKMIAYLRTHYVWAAASIGAFLKAGSYERFLSKEIQTEAYVAMREGFKICIAQGIDPRGVSPTRYFYFPLWILVPFTRKMYDNDGMKRMFEGHVRHSPKEIKIMYDDVARLGDQYGIAMPTFHSFKPFVDAHLVGYRSDT